MADINQIPRVGSRTTSANWVSCSSSTRMIRSARCCTSYPSSASWPTNMG